MKRTLLPRRTAAAPILGYQPTDWTRTKTPQGDWVYADPNLNVLQANLITLNTLVDDLRVAAKIDILEIQTNLSTPTIKDPMIATLALITGKIVEGLAMAWPAGSALAVIAGVAARLTSAGVQWAARDHKDDPDLQGAVNDLRDFVDANLSQLTDLISSWIEDPQLYWTQVYQCPGSLISDLRGPVTLSELVDPLNPQYFPRKGHDVAYNTWHDRMIRQSKTAMTQSLLPVKFKIRDINGFTESDSRWFWAVQWWETSSTSVYNSWRKDPGFPGSVPGNLRDSIGGPWTDIGLNSDYKGGRQYYQCWDNTGKPDTEFPGWSRHYWTRNSSSRWMSRGGQHCANMNGGDQGPSCDYRVDPQGNIVQGTPFLDWLDEVLRATDSSPGWTGGDQQINNVGWAQCGLVWYRFKDSRNKQEWINSRQEVHHLTTDYCNDYRYEKNVFKWNWLYRGIRLNMWVLVDENGHPMADSTAKWLFKDNGHGKITNTNGLANKIDVYHNWGLKTY
jgi:hypothetical protein